MKIENMIFDLGVVLLDLDFEASWRAYLALNRGEELPLMHVWMNRPEVAEFETGALTPDGFRDRIRRVLNNPDATDEALDAAWYAMLGDFPAEKAALLQRLRPAYKLFLFSNINVLHVTRFEAAFIAQYGFPVASLFDQVFYSNEIGDRKPNLTSFQKVLQRAGIRARETLFIDDNEANVAGAAAAGLRALHYTPGEDLAAMIDL